MFKRVVSIGSLLVSILFGQSVFGQALIRYDNFISISAFDEVAVLSFDSENSRLDSGGFGVGVEDFFVFVDASLAIAREERMKFREALKILVDSEKITEALIASVIVSGSLDDANEAAAIALAINGLFKSPPNSDDFAFTANSILLNDILVEEIAALSRPVFGIFAEGQVLEVFKNQNEESNDFGGTGALGIRRSSPLWSFTGRITVAASDNLISDNYALSILPRTGGGSLNSGSLDFVFTDTVGDGIDLHVYGSGTSYRWTVEGSPEDDSDVVVVGLGALVKVGLVSTKIGSTNVAAIAEFGLSTRILSGADMADPEQRQKFLEGETVGEFAGIELGLQLQLGDVVGAFQYYQYGGPAISGVTKGAIVAGFGINADLFSDFE